MGVPGYLSAPWGRPIDLYWAARQARVDIPAPPETSADKLLTLTLTLTLKEQ
jgi:hypothetical protein